MKKHDNGFKTDAGNYGMPQKAWWCVLFFTIFGLPSCLSSHVPAVKPGGGVPISEREFCIPSSEFKLGDVPFGTTQEQVLQIMGKPMPPKSMYSRFWSYHNLDVDWSENGSFMGMSTKSPLIQTPSGVKVGMGFHEVVDILKMPVNFILPITDTRYRNCPGSLWKGWLRFGVTKEGVVEDIEMIRYWPCLPADEFSLGGIKIGMTKDTVQYMLGKPLQVVPYNGPTLSISDYKNRIIRDAIEVLMYEHLNISILKEYNVVFFISTTSPASRTPSGIRPGIPLALFKGLAGFVSDEEPVDPIGICPTDDYSLWDPELSIEADAHGNISSVMIGIENAYTLLDLLTIIPHAVPANSPEEPGKDTKDK